MEQVKLGYPLNIRSLLESQRRKKGQKENKQESTITHIVKICSFGTMTLIIRKMK